MNSFVKIKLHYYIYVKLAMECKKREVVYSVIGFLFMQRMMIFFFSLKLFTMKKKMRITQH